MNDYFKSIRSWALSKGQRFLFEDINKCKGEKVFAPMRRGSSCWTNMLRLLYEIKIKSSSVLQIWLGSLRELHYLSDLVRLLASRCIEQDDAIFCGGWCSEFRCAVGRRRRGQEDEPVTWAGLSQLWKLVTWRKSFFPPWLCAASLRALKFRKAEGETGLEAALALTTYSIRDQSQTQRPYNDF